MRNLSLIAPRSRNDETNLWSNRDGKMTGPSLVGSVLARRYKILEAVDVDSFKAQDLTLDQTVTVRRALLASQRAGKTWRQKVQQLALMRDPNFLNILDVIARKIWRFCHYRAFQRSLYCRPVKERVHALTWKMFCG
jgi:hypothetical protein